MPPFNGSGTFTPYTPGNPVVTGTVISSTAFNATQNDIATGLTNAITRDGQSPPTADLPMANQKHTAVGNAVARNQYASLGQSQDGGALLITGISGTDTITGSLAPALPAYATGQTFRFVSAGANTGAVTININALGAKAITKNGATPLVAGDIASGAALTIIYDGTQFQLSSAAGVSASSTTTFTNKTITDSTNTVYANAGPSNTAFSFRNKIINGALDIWQRGTSFTTVGAYTADRFKYDKGSGTGYTISRQTLTAESSLYCLRVQRDSGSSDVATCYLMQAIESSAAYGLRGQFVTLSFEARKGANFSPTALNAYIYSGTGTDQGSPHAFTGAAIVGSQAIAAGTLTTSFQRFTVTTSAAIASTVTQLGVSFQTNGVGTAGAADHYEIKNIQLEAGSVATPFETRPYGTELALCQRYYYRASVASGAEYGVGYNISTTTQATLIPFPVPMRAAVTALEQTGTATDYSVLHGSTNTACSSVPTFASGSNISARATFTVAAGLTAGSGSMGRSNGASSYFGFSAEL